MQWNPSNTSSSVNVLYPPLLSPAPPYPGSATYSFTADFRPANQPPNLLNNQNNQNSTNFNSLSLNNIGNTNLPAQSLGTILEPISKGPPSPLTNSPQRGLCQNNLYYPTPKTSPIFEVSSSNFASNQIFIFLPFRQNQNQF